MSRGKFEYLHVSIQQPGRTKLVEIKSKGKEFTTWNVRERIYKGEEMYEVLQEGT